MLNDLNILYIYWFTLFCIIMPLAFIQILRNKPLELVMAVAFIVAGIASLAIAFCNRGEITNG